MHNNASKVFPRRSSHPGPGLFFQISLFLTAAGLLNGAASAQSVSGNQFNPSISLILNGQYSAYSNRAEDFEISGFLIDDEAGPIAEGFSLDESELVISANIDDQYYGFVDVAFVEEAGGGTEVELEEAYFQTLNLPSGLTVKGGKFFSSIGYHNVFHAHTWHFADAPLAYQAMLGTTFADTGLQLRWLAPMNRFLELGVEFFQGNSFPAANDGGNAGAYSVFVKTGGDIGISHSWKAGLSYLDYDALDRDGGEALADLTFAGEGDLFIADFVWKWAENGNPRSRNFIIQSEYLQRDEHGQVDFFNGVANESGPYDLRQSGFYLQGIYQFRPRWRVGLRYDRLSSSNQLPALSVVTPLSDDGRNPRRLTAMVDFSNSEFSRLRLQFSRDESSADSDTRVLLQYVMSIGAHGAHQF
ncbi:MAG: outer membrane beta-barrel protein [Proteobacteria bacterium]|nr:outer membrane beta-barrel protein [Pseudomonadota bacterium]